MKYQIKCSSKEQQNVIIKMLGGLGYNPGLLFSEDNINQFYPYLLIDSTEMRLAGNYDYRIGSGELVTVEEFINILGKKKVEVKLNDSYTAIVTDDGYITVGCQKFSWSVVDKLAHEIKKIRDVQF